MKLYVIVSEKEDNFHRVESIWDNNEVAQRIKAKYEKRNDNRQYYILQRELNND